MKALLAKMLSERIFATTVLHETLIYRFFCPLQRSSLRFRATAFLVGVLLVLGSAVVSSAAAAEESSSPDEYSYSSTTSSKLAAAYHDSHGFFTDIPDAVWQRRKQKHRKVVLEQHNRGEIPERPQAWYQRNYDPTLTCPDQEKIGGAKDGGKWVCDPHRIGTSTGEDETTNAAAHSFQPPARARPNNSSCLIYSIGSNFDFGFELSALAGISGKCEIHVFDPLFADLEKAKREWTRQLTQKRRDDREFFLSTRNKQLDLQNVQVYFHNFGLQASQEASVSHLLLPWNPPEESVLVEATAAATRRRQEKNIAPKGVVKVMKSLFEMRSFLGHTNRTIDVFKMDCEGCEWEVFAEIFAIDEKVEAATEAGKGDLIVAARTPAIRQVLIELHEGTNLHYNSSSRNPHTLARGCGPIPQAERLFRTARKHGWVLFAKEANIQGTDGRCVEVSFLKMERTFFGLED
ncbi:unnamed protein product [Amoebophrya sp. A120]|nr:unnamed protein product [Amoebophrya sp. A120]|eukprot:GSA120T00008324001.1